MSLADYLRDVARHPVGNEPRTLQDLIDRRVTLDAHAAATTGAELFTPRMVWRLAWLSTRQVQLLYPLLPDPKAAELSRRYLDHLADFAGHLHRQSTHDRPQGEIVTRYFSESVEFWATLGSRASALSVGTLPWIEQDFESLRWIRLSIFYVCSTFTRTGRPRSRREVATILGETLKDSIAPNTIRLRVAPAIERDLKAADRWADLCAAQRKPFSG